MSTQKPDIETLFCWMCGKDVEFKVLWGNSHAVLWGNSHAVLWEDSHAELKSPLSVAIRRSETATTSGLLIVEAFRQEPTAAAWLKAVGAEVRGDKATLYKRVASDYSTRNGIVYKLGTHVEAPDWDPNPECGGGLHFCGDPAGGDLFRSGEGDKYVACEILIADIVVHEHPNYPDKVKAKACDVLYEVDHDGKQVAS